MPKIGDYLLRRPGSRNWYFQVMTPPSIRAKAPEMPRKFVKSTGTADRVEARIISAPWLREWRDALTLNQVDLHPPEPVGFVLEYKMKPGTKLHNADGTVTVARTNEIVTYDADFNVVREESNHPLKMTEGFIMPHIDGGHLRFYRNIADRRDDGYERIGVPEFEDERDLDTEIIENWARKNNINSRFLDDAKNTLALFHEVNPGCTFAAADYDNGVALADALFGRGNKSATVRKKVAFMRAAFNIAKLSPKRFPGVVNKDNPFSRVIRKVDDDALDKKMLDDDDMVLIRARMDELGKNERILLTWCLATGCRRGEPFEVVGERKIDGFRTIRFGTKTEASDRTIPLPPALLELHGEPITGPIFTDTEVNIGKRINTWLRKIGIIDPGKTLHSTRHRASYKLRRFKDSVRWECLGHENRNEASEGYGEYPQDELYDALKTIGL